LVLSNDANQLEARNARQKRDFDSIKIFNRKRNAHACIMSIVFIILYPLGAISVHLPIDRIPGLRNSYLRNKIMAIHMPIQILGTVMMIGAMCLGIRLAHEQGYLSGHVHAHIVIGLLVVSVIVLMQPVMGLLQHRYFKKKGGKGVFAFVHRWVGRGALILGIINNGLGFQLTSKSGLHVPRGSYIRNFVIAGILVLIYIGLVAYDGLHGQSRAELSREEESKVKVVPNVDAGTVTHA
jgi:hypothetical protein